MSLEVAPPGDRDWMAEVVLLHVDPSQLEDFDWRGQFIAKNTLYFKIDQKVTSNEYKNVVILNQGEWYGNDLTGEEPESWTDDMPERLAEFASSIMTLG
ncbi:hypothetical protein F5X68DRAFT_231635 [Plectosphaerella plurivora]|uniref:Uncharacterized protein n=1 Tax=Plectosphaerella plurivora TaxID=936078 RepID=A0A9P8VBT5_9PEZI|nr:hypothetical protein F5X68DRAFT_231635 [Plectosphaerella plurivora]